MEFGNKQFKNKTQAIAFFKEYLHSHDEIDTEDYSTIEALIKSHPRGLAPEDTVIITTDSSHGKASKCFAVQSKDGSIDCRSVPKCINGYNQKQDVNKILRESIVPQLMEFKRNNTIPTECPLCKEPLKDVHIDHILEFRNLVKSYFEDKHVSFEDIEIIRESGTKTFKDKNLLDGFINYHKDHATLRYICAHCNLTR